jgi:phosphate transport system ATP-binding protein
MPVPSHVVFRNVSVRIDGTTALDDVSLEIARHEIFAIVGPANSGKSTLLKCINRTIDFAPNVELGGAVMVGGDDVFKVKDVCALRRRVAMVSPLPVGLPLSVYDNVAYAARLAGMHRRADLDVLVERCLRQAALWDEVKDRLQQLGTLLSGGQQQRLTLARALSHAPEILCLNRFSIAVDPVTTMKMEDVLLDLKARVTIVVVTNIVQQAHRLADRVAFLNRSRLIEVGATDLMFSDHPAQPSTLAYMRGLFG